MADSGAAGQSIDAGDVFNKMIAQPSQPGFENNIGEAHRALERETRDDGWAYSMEAEIQNAMVTEVSTGAFRSEHVECRATMCELRLSGKGEQAAAIKRWSDELGSQPFGQRLSLNYSSSISDNNRVDTRRSSAAANMDIPSSAKGTHRLPCVPFVGNENVLYDYCPQLAPRTTIASAVQAFTERNGPRVVSCLSVDCSSMSRRRTAPSF